MAAGAAKRLAARSYCRCEQCAQAVGRLRLQSAPSHIVRGMKTEAGATLISSATIPPGPAFVARPRLAVLVVTIGALVWAIDQVTKRWALASLAPGEVRPFLGEVLQFALVFNPGAAFSLGTGITPVFTLAMAVVAVAILLALRRLRSFWWALALGLLLGGALGNLTDRLSRPPGFARGHVVDFLMLPHWPVFNVADSSIVTATALIAVAAFRGVDFDSGREPPTTAVDDSQAGPGKEVSGRG